MKPRDLEIGMYYEEPNGRVWEYVGITPHTIWKYAFRSLSGKSMEVSSNYLSVLSVSFKYKAIIEIEEWLND